MQSVELKRPAILVLHGPSISHSGGGDLNSKMKGNEGEKRRRRKKSCTTVMMQPNDVDDVLDLDQEYEIASGNNALVNTAIPILGNELVIDCPR